jgi:hypothetical protein
MDHLNKHQVVLLTLLVSFVTSIATGITTVSLLDQAPASVTQTINRVVERTIEKVVTGEVPPAPVLPPKEVTVVVSEEKFITNSVARVSESIVRIKNKKDGALLGMGIIIDDKGTIVGDGSIMLLSKEFQALYKNNLYDLDLLNKEKRYPVALFQVSSSSFPVSLGSPIVFEEAINVKSGQSIVSISGQERDVISVGIVSSIIEALNQLGINEVKSFDTSINLDGLLSGTPVANLEGEVIALKIGKDESGKDILMTATKVTELVRGLGR